MSAYELYAEYRPNDRRKYIGGRATESAIIRLLGRYYNSDLWPGDHAAVIYGPDGRGEYINPDEANSIILNRAFPRDARV